MKIAFIVEFPTQFEVPFYQYVAERLSVNRRPQTADFDSHFDPHFDSAQCDIAQCDMAQREKAEGFDFHVIYNNTDQQDYHDFELGKKVGWGFNLYEGYTYFIVDKNDIVSSVSSILEKEDYDYVILNGYKNSYAGLPELCKNKNIPIALRIDSVLYNLSPIKKFVKRIYLPFAYRKFDHFFAVGSETRRFLNWLRIKNERISYFSYSVDEEWFKEKANNTEKVNALRKRLGIHNEKVLLSVAKFVPRESPWDILKAFEKLNDSNLVLILVGDGPERKTLENYVSQISLNIIFVGYVLYQELGYYYGISDVFIHAAKNEPWGVSVHEAIACGCSVVASERVGSAKDLILEGSNGYSYLFGNYIQLADAIIKSLKLNSTVKDNTNLSLLKRWGYEKMWNEIKKASQVSLHSR